MKVFSISIRDFLSCVSEELRSYILQLFIDRVSYVKAFSRIRYEIGNLKAKLWICFSSTTSSTFYVADFILPNNGPQFKIMGLPKIFFEAVSGLFICEKLWATIILVYVISNTPFWTTHCWCISFYVETFFFLCSVHRTVLPNLFLHELFMRNSKWYCFGLVVHIVRFRWQSACQENAIFIV